MSGGRVPCVIGILLSVGVLASVSSGSGSAVAFARPAPLAPTADPAADAGSLSADAEQLERQARQIRALLGGRLDSDIDPRSLFDLPIDASDERMQVERRRLERVLREQEVPPPTAPPDPAKAPLTPAGGTGGPSGALPPVVSSAPAAGGEDAGAVEPGLWRARLELDRARLAFIVLPVAQRIELVRRHEADRQGELSGHEEAINQAEAAARRASELEGEARDAARRSSTEAARLINEEHARLLVITRQQAEYERSMIQRRAELDLRNEHVLAWRRQVSEILQQDPLDVLAQEHADSGYVQLRVTILEARTLLSSTLSSLGDGVDSVPQAGPDPLVDLPAEVDRGVAVRQRQIVTDKARELLAAERALENEEARELMSETEALNRLRLELLSGLSPEKRAATLGFGLPGWDQATAEIWQVTLTARYHAHAALDWLSAIREGDRHAQSARLASAVVLKWIAVIALFVWWRRRAHALLGSWIERRRLQARLRRDAGRLQVDYAQSVAVFLRRVSTPLGWLLLVGLVTWVLPEPMAALLEVRLAKRVLLWVFGGRFIVLAVDALFAQSAATEGASATARLRLSSLRLVGKTIVFIGLPLSISDLLVGQGTVHGWVLSTCWLASIPVLLVIIGWWRPFIFERFTRMRKPNAFESWVLAHRSPEGNLVASVLSSLAAVAGGIYLFVVIDFRIVRNRILSFELTRRLLAYLFRRDLRKRARGAQLQAYAPLPEDTFRALGPEVRSARLVRSAADGQVQDVIDRIKAAGGGAIAIVGERGAGKTTLIERIVASCTGLVAISCHREGLAGLRAALNQALGQADATELAVAARSIDSRKGDHAVLIDDAQYLVRPMMGGLAELDQVLALFRRHSTNCAWVLAFDAAVWSFIERSRGARPLFDHVIRLSPWSEDAIVGLITERNLVAEVTPDFGELAVDLPADADEGDIEEAVGRTAASYYRLLWDYASGNPGVALHFWRLSLGVAPSGKLHVRLFEVPNTVHLEALSDSAAFVFRAILQLGWATADDISGATSLGMAEVEDALRYGSQRGYFEMDGPRYRINWNWFRAVTRFLKHRHLSFSAG
jgi:hypothetical protein